MADDSVDHFFQVDHFMKKCLKLECDMEAVMAQNKELYMDMQKKAKQPKITSFFTKSSVSPSAMHCMLFNHPENFQPGMPTSSQ
jgi:hypothetical protein